MRKGSLMMRFELGGMGGGDGGGSGGEGGEED